MHTSVDTLLATENDNFERVIETIKIGGAEFEIIEKPETILAGKVIYAKDYEGIDGFNCAIESVTEEEKLTVFNAVRENVLPVTDIHLSVNFWLDEKIRAFGFVREVTTVEQAEGVDLY